jgi:hypothetical protein
MIDSTLFPFVLLVVGLVNYALGYLLGVRSRRCIVNGTLFRVIDDGRLVGISKDMQIFMHLEQLTEKE